jgi:hypothetical protein
MEITDKGHQNTEAQKIKGHQNTEVQKTKGHQNTKVQKIFWGWEARIISRKHFTFFTEKPKFNN